MKRFAGVMDRTPSRKPPILIHMKRFIIALLLCVGIASGQDHKQGLPIDPSIQIGKLENGLEYWIRQHKTPPGKISMWLHVDSGSLNEEEKQRGVAHFLEHMAFNGTENHPPGTLIKYFESIGLRFGQHQNAFTSFDQTTYTLSLPDTKEETIRKGLLTLADFGFRITFPPAEIEQERPVILAEARARKGVGQRLLEKALPILLPGSLLANRLPIGTEEVIQKVKREDFLDYYKKWYRPNDSTLLVVGDADPALIVRLIGQEFGEWPSIQNPPPDVDAGIQPYTKTKPAVLTDPELTTAEVSTVRVRELEQLQTLGQFRTELVDDLGTSILNRRLLGLVEEGKAAFQSASVTIAPFQNKYLIQEAQAYGAPEQWNAMLTQLITEMKRAREFGFLQSELEDARKATLAAAEQAQRTEATWDANTFLSRMNSAVSQRRKPMSASQSLELIRQLLPSVTLEEVTNSFRNNFSVDSRLILVTVPEKEGLPKPTEERILAEANRVEAAAVTRYEAKERPRSLLEKEPEPGSIVEKQEEEETKILSATLSNNVRIHLREMDFKKNSVSAMIHIAGGEIRETAANRGITQASMMAFSQPATQQFSSTVIREYLTGKNVTVNGFAGGDSVVLMVAGSPDDFEEGMRLAYLLLTQPKLEESALRLWREESTQAIEQRKTSVEAQAMEKQSELLSGEDPRFKTLTVEDVKRIDGKNAQAWLEKTIAKAPMEVAIVGDLDRDKMEELALKYLGALSERLKQDPDLEKLRAVEVKPGPLQERIEVSTITPRGIVITGWRGVNFPQLKERRTLDLAAQILSSRMQAEIREKRGLTYSVNTTSIPAVGFPETGFFGTVFSADPEKVGQAAQVAREMMLEFAEKGPTEAEMQTVRNQMRNILETQQKEPSYWVRILSELDYRGIRLEDVKNLVPQITSYTRDDIVQSLQKYIREERQLEVVALPKSAQKQ